MAGLLRLQTTRRDYGCAAGSNHGPLPPYPPPPPRLRPRPRPRPLVASTPAHTLREGCRSSLARGRPGWPPCVASVRQPLRKRGRVAALATCWFRVLPAGGHPRGLEQTVNFEHFERCMQLQLLSGESSNLDRGASQFPVGIARECGVPARETALVQLSADSPSPISVYQ